MKVVENQQFFRVQFRYILAHRFRKIRKTIQQSVASGWLTGQHPFHCHGFAGNIAA